MNIYYSTDYTASDYAFDTTRKSEWIADSLATAPIDGVTLVSPSGSYELTETLIDRVHDRSYVRAVRSGTPTRLAESQGFRWDPGIYPMALAHCAGVVAATQDAIANGRSGCLSSGLHHADTSEGAGYCTFNGLAVAAEYAAHHCDLEVMVIDFDAHCGGGTMNIAGDFIRQIDVSVSPFDRYAVNNDSAHLLRFANTTNYLDVIIDALTEAADFRGDLIIYNAGMDPLNFGVTPTVLAHRELLVSEFINSIGCPALFTLAGGYLSETITEDDLVAAHRLTLGEWA